MDAQLSSILAATMQSDKAVRQQAEDALRSAATQPDFILHLIRYATQTQASGAPPQCLLAAAIQVRNFIGKCDWNRSKVLPDPIKEAVREILVPLQCSAHVEEHIRRQLLSATSEILQYDYPERWPHVMPQVSGILEKCMAALVPLQQVEEVLPVLLQLKGALGVLRYCCKVHEDPTKVSVELLDQYSSTFIPSILSLWDFLIERWEAEARSACASAGSMAPCHGNLFELTPLLAEYSHCLRLCWKCIWSLCSNRWPKILCSEDNFSHLLVSCLQRPARVLQEVLLPVFRQRIVNNVEETQWYGDRFSEFQESSVWRLLKWCGTAMHKLVQDFSAPKHCEKRARSVAKLFVAHYMPGVTQYSLDLVRWHATPLSLNSKAYIMALETITLCVVEPVSYSTVLLPYMEEMMIGLLFPRLSFTSEDAELWNLNPEEYVRRQSSPTGDLFNAKVVSASLLLSLVVPSKPFHDQELLSKLLHFIVCQLSSFSDEASRTSPGEPASPAMESARRVDAALYALYHLKKVVKSFIQNDDSAMLQDVLLNYVVPATRYPVGFLRARAVQVLSVYSKTVPWTDAAAFQQTLSAVIPLLKDPEAPVQVQTCVSFSLMIHHPFAWDVVNPCIGEIVQQYFNVMRMIDNEAVVRTLQKTIQIYSSSLCQWAVELTDLISQHFFKSVESMTGKYAAFESGAESTESLLEDNALVDLLMTADELLETLSILIKSIPEPSCATSEATVNTIMLHIQERVGPVLHFVLSYQSGTSFGFMDCALRLLTVLLARSRSIVPGLWGLIPFLYQLVARGAADYFSQMLPPLDNYSSVDPMSFLLVPLSELCGSAAACGDEFVAQLTPAELVIQMGDIVLRSDSLRLREKASVPKICDAFLQNYWWSATNSDFPPSPKAMQIVRSVCDMLLTKQIPVASSPTFGILLANSILSSLLVDVKATSSVLCQHNMLPTFFSDYCALMAQPETLSLLRGYDRRLFIAALAEGVEKIENYKTSNVMDEWATPMSLLEASIHSVLETQLVFFLAAQDADEAAKETEEFLKHRHNADSEEWESDSSDDEMGLDMEDDEEDEFGADDGNAGDDQDGKLEQLIHQAQAVREANYDAGGAGEDEMDDNLLDEECFESPIIDKINAWKALAEVVQERQSSSHAAALLMTSFSGKQWEGVMRASDVLTRWNEAQMSTSG